MAARALVIFSTGAEGTSITPEDLADRAISAGVAVYPVGLPGFPWVLPYEGYTYVAPNGFYFYPSKQEQMGDVGKLLSMFGPGGANFVKGATRAYPSGCGNCGNYFASYFNYPFELLGDLTGGRRFDANNHNVIPEGDIPPGLLISEGLHLYSMTGSETHDVLERVKRHALARFSSTYTVGFVPSPSGAPRQHELEVQLASKSTGKVTEGKRSATY
jgi:hypothetical protein